MDAANGRSRSLEVAAEQQAQQDEAATQPALSPRSPEPPAPLEQEVQERPVVGLRQPPPPPRSECPQYQHRTTQQWLGRQMYEPQYAYDRTGDDYAIKKWNKLELLMKERSRWEEQMTTSGASASYTSSKGPTSGANYV